MTITLTLKTQKVYKRQTPCFPCVLAIIKNFLNQFTSAAIVKAFYKRWWLAAASRVLFVTYLAVNEANERYQKNQDSSSFYKISTKVNNFIKQLCPHLKTTDITKNQPFW